MDCGRMLPRGRRLLLFFAGLLCAAQQPAGPRILRPLDNSVVEKGPLSIIAKSSGDGELKLDGQPLTAAKPANGVLTATVEPKEGPHELVLTTGGADYKIRFHVGASAPADWKNYRSHPPIAVECTTCHSASGGQWALKEEVAGPSCMTCHDAATFPKAHTHKPEELEECQMCHNPHGSTASRHLIMTKEVACKQCHG